MPQQLVILGTTGYAHDILDVVDAANSSRPTWEVIGFLDDAHPRGAKYQGFEVLGGVRDASRLIGVSFINSIGSERSFRKRCAVIGRTGLPSDRFATLIHPFASVSKRARVGPGSCVNVFARIAGGVTIGSHVWLGAACSIEDESTVEDYTVVGTGAVLTSGVHVRASAYIGARAALRSRVQVGEKAQVGLGATVIGDVAPSTVVVGNPARTLVRDRSSNSGQHFPKSGNGTSDTPPPRGGI